VKSASGWHSEGKFPKGEAEFESVPVPSVSGPLIILIYGAVHLVTACFGQWLCMRQIGDQNFRNFFLAWDENLFFRQLKNDSKSLGTALQDV